MLFLIQHVYQFSSSNNNKKINISVIVKRKAGTGSIFRFLVRYGSVKFE